LLFKLPPELRNKIWEYSVAVRAPTSRPKCEAHFPDRAKPTKAKKSRLSRKSSPKIKNGQPPPGLSIAEQQLWRDRHPFECTCPTAELPRFYPSGSSSFDFEDVEELEQQDPRPYNDPRTMLYTQSRYPGILTASKRTREESLASFYNVNRFMFPGSHSRYQDRDVMNWLLARRKYLKHFYHIEWYAPTDEIGLRSYAVIIMLVELGVLRGAVVRRSRLLVDRYPLPPNGGNDRSAPGIWTALRLRRSVHDPVMPTASEELDNDCHILCALRLAVRERIQQKRIYVNAVLHRDVEELEEMMSAVAGKFWRGCSMNWCQTPCSICSSRGRRIVGEPVLRGLPGRDQGVVPAKSQTSAETEGLPTL
jgi:hypothetical protein